MRELKRFEEAVRSYDAALAITPDHLGAINNRGTALRDLGHYDEALKSYDAVLARDPKSWQAYNNKGNLLNAMGRLDDAVAAFERAILEAPCNAECHYNLGNAEQDRGRYIEAMQSYGKALTLRPKHVEALINRAGAARRLKLYKKALADYAAAKRENPAFPYLDGFIAHTRADCCDWSRLDEEKSLLEQVRRGERASEPFSLLSLSDDENAHEICAKTWLADKFAVATVAKTSPIPDDHRLRVAYLSPDFRNHAVSSVLARLIEIHDRRQFRILAVAFGPKVDDGMSRRMASAFDAWIDVREVSDATAAERLSAEGVDIAVDLAGYTEHARTGILARRPAPVQVSYLGYPASMGAPFIDYLIADRWVLPEASRPCYTEKVVYLPDSYQVNEVWKQVPAPANARADVGLPAAGFVYCCFSSSRKIRPQMFDIWMRLLKRTPGSVLWLVGDSPEGIANLRREAQKRDIAPERLVFAGRVGGNEYLSRYQLADLFLDTLPYNAHAIGSDALRAGLPLITCVGSSFAGRVAASLLGAVGLPELITTSLEDYEALAVRLAENPTELARLRTTLIANSATQALFDTDRFRRNIEAAYLEMHRRHRAGEAPADFAVAPS